jgi:hypothetical protein
MATLTKITPDLGEEVRRIQDTLCGKADLKKSI